MCNFARLNGGSTFAMMEATWRPYSQRAQPILSGLDLKMLIYAYVCAYIYICVCVCVCMYHTYIHMHTCINTCTCT